MSAGATGAGKSEGEEDEEAREGGVGNGGHDDDYGEMFWPGGVPYANGDAPWMRFVDPGTGKYYYYNPRTDGVQWERPRPLQQQQQPFDNNYRHHHNSPLHHHHHHHHQPGFKHSDVLGIPVRSGSNSSSST